MNRPQVLGLGDLRKAVGYVLDMDADELAELCRQLEQRNAGVLV
jgi:hypothetical protein